VTAFWLSARNGDEMVNVGSRRWRQPRQLRDAFIPLAARGGPYAAAGASETDLASLARDESAQSRPCPRPAPAKPDAAKNFVQLLVPVSVSYAKGLTRSHRLVIDPNRPVADHGAMQ
jgi:hypothetical protein